MSRRALAALLSLAFVVPACSCRKTDAERAKEEREKIDRKLRESLTLFPYRLVKLSLRSAKSPKRPAAVDSVMKLLDETKALPERPATAEEIAHEAATYARLLKALYDARESMMKHDEDDFPTLADSFAPGTLPSPPWDAQLEHLALAALWFIVDAADRSHRVPGGTEYVFYELSRAEPQPGWPADVRRFAQLLRGAAFCATEHHYAAEEELTNVVKDLEAATVADFSGYSKEVSKEEVFHTLRAAAYLARAWNRLGLERDDAAADDLEKGLAELKAMGVDNELTQWGWAVVHAHRGRYADAAAELDKLAASPNLDGETKKELADAAKSMREHGKGIPVLLEARAMLIVGQALLARSGGVEKILVTLLGEEKGKELAEPVRWLERTRRAIAQTPGEKLEEGKELGAKGLEALKKRVEEIRSPPPDAGPSPPQGL